MFLTMTTTTGLRETVYPNPVQITTISVEVRPTLCVDMNYFITVFKLKDEYRPANVANVSATPKSRF